MTAVTPGRELLANKLCAEYREIERAAETDAALSDSGRERIISDCHASIRGVRALAARLAAKPADDPDIFGIAVHALTVGAPGIGPTIRDGIARSISMRVKAVLSTTLDPKPTPSLTDPSDMGFPR